MAYKDHRWIMPLKVYEKAVIDAGSGEGLYKIDWEKDDQTQQVYPIIRPTTLGEINGRG